MSIIYYNIEALYQTSVEGSETSTEMWNRLLLEYANVASANASQLTSAFYQYRMDPSHSVAAHANKMRMMSEELKSVGAEVSQEILIMRILQTLPPSFDVFLVIWNTVPSVEQTIINLIARLITEEQRIKARNGGTEAPADTAFFATHPCRSQQQSSRQNESAYVTNADHWNRRGRQNQDQRSNRHHHYNHNGGRDRDRERRNEDRDTDNGRRNKGRERGCYVCGKSGHKSSSCWYRKDIERRDARAENHNKRRDNGPGTNKSFCAVSSFCFVSRKSTDWYADSGATHHMTDQRAFFREEDFKEVPSGTWNVNGVGGVSIEAAGIGTVPVQSFVGGKTLEGEMRDVLYVPNLGTIFFPSALPRTAALMYISRGVRCLSLRTRGEL